MEQKDPDQFLNFCCEMGRQLIENGAEIYRVEESADRLLAAYGYQEAEVFAIPAYIILNIQDETRNYTKSVRIKTFSINLDKLDRLNALCRRVCQETPDVDAAYAQLREIMAAPTYPDKVGYLAYGFVALCFTLFWGGHAGDACVAFVCGILVKATFAYMGKVNSNVFFTYVCASFFLVLPPMALTYLGTGIHIDKIVIGAIMLLVPGIAITNVMRDVIAGDFLTAVMRFAEVMIIAMAIAIGIALPYSAAKMLLGAI